MNAAANYEKLGQFYLGKEFDQKTQTISDELLLYNSKDLVTHGVVLGMTGSGKTGLCISLLEEAAMDHIPAIIIDPKGDISNLLLTFPDLDAKSFQPWVSEEEAARKSQTVPEFAEKIAATWKKGLAEWGQDGERIRSFRQKSEIHVFTPGSSAGIPVSILSSFEVPPVEVLEDSELLAETVSSTVESLLSLVGLATGETQTPEAALLSAIFLSEWKAGSGLSMETLIGKIQKPRFTKVGVIDLETFYPEKERQKLAMKFNSLLASPSFSTWLEGVPLDIARILHREDGKPRISIFSIAHLNDAERMFFVSLLLNQMVRWMRTQRGTTSLRALLYMDEVFGFLPPTANPPSKRPMMILLKQARAFGVGCLLATQNPMDLDYKALSNIGTWFLGKLQTERDKARLLDGLEGAAGEQNQKFQRKEIETLLSSLGNRVFLMKNIHEEAPVLFHARWAMSYLPGPLSRIQIKELMDPKRKDFPLNSSQAAPQEINPMAKSSTSGTSRPIVGSGVVERFVSDGGGIYEPYLYREATVHFSLAKAGVEGSRKIVKINPIIESGIDWESTDTICPRSLVDRPDETLLFAELPGFAMNAKNYQAVEKDFSEELYREERMEIWSYPAQKIWAEIGETEEAFRLRLVQETREARDQSLEKARETAEKKTKALEERLRTLQLRLEKEKAESSSAKMQAGISILGSVLKMAMGRKAGLTHITRGSSAISKASAVLKQSKDVSIAEQNLTSLQAEMEAIGTELDQELASIQQTFDPSSLVLEKETLKPTRTDVKVETVGLLWKC